MATWAQIAASFRFIEDADVMLSVTVPESSYDTYDIVCDDNCPFCSPKEGS